MKGVCGTLAPVNTVSQHVSVTIVVLSIPRLHVDSDLDFIFVRYLLQNSFDNLFAKVLA